MRDRLAQIRADCCFKGKGRRRAGKWDWDEWVTNETDEKALLAGHRPSLSKAAHVCEFFERYLHLSKSRAATTRFILIPFQRRFLRRLFGWVRPDGTRRFRMGYISWAKKNTKSATMSGVGLYGLVADGERGAEIYAAASDKAQAGIVFSESAHMVEHSPDLSRHLTVVRSRKRIVLPGQEAWYQALSADVPTKEGLHAHFVIFDELHAQATRDLFDTLRYAGAARSQPLFLMITTAGYDKLSICYEQYQYAKRVNERLGPASDDLAFFTYICEVDEAADWKDESLHAGANPGWDTILNQGDFRRDFEEAKQSLLAENRFRRYRLNQWVQQEVRAIGEEAWRKCGGQIKDSDLVGVPCMAGLDVAQSQDLNALCLSWKLKNPSRIVSRWWYWAPRDGAEKRQRQDRVPYLTWEKAKLIKLTEGNEIDYEVMTADILAIASQYYVREIGVDALFQGAWVCQELKRNGMRVLKFPQTFTAMAAATAECIRLINRGEFRHGDNAITTWQAGHVSTEQDPVGNIKFSKKKSRERIDGLIAWVQSIALILTAQGGGSCAVVYTGDLDTEDDE